MKKSVQVLDCTLRDGGYYNHWDFETDVVRRYLQSVAAAGIDAVEVGFRSLPQAGFMGPYAYTTDEFLESLDLPKGPRYGVMINAKDYLDYPGGPIPAIRQQFRKANASPVSLVRVAINYNAVAKAEGIVRELHGLGYTVGLNLMQSHGRTEAEYRKTAADITAWNAVDILYFADSLGNMNPSQVKAIANAIHASWNGPLGIHTHNNKGLALINSITAIENGVDWCDATVTGMGRGAGNVTTESLMIELCAMGHHRGNPASLQMTIDDFSRLREKYGWGPSFYYHLAAMHNIHPTFIQELMGDKRYSNKQLMSAIDFLADKESSSYSSDHLVRAIYDNRHDARGEWDPTGWLKGRDALIVATGPSVKRYRDGIVQYIRKAKPAVFFLNINADLPEELATATIVSHQTRVLFDAQDYQRLKHPLILPLAQFGEIIKDQLKGLKTLDYGLALEKGVFDIGPRGCRLPAPLSAAYAMAVATQAGASGIKLVGFDGFTADDPRHEEMNEVFQIYAALPNALSVVSLTPSSYRIDQQSVFAPVLGH